MSHKPIKICVSQEADQAIDRMMVKANTGFAGGKVSKTDMASWILIQFESQGLESCIEKIRKDHFDQVSYLESVLKEMKHARKNGGDAPDLTVLLAPVTSNLKGTQKKRVSSEATEA